MERLQTIGLGISALILLACLGIGLHIKSQYPKPTGVNINQALESGGLEKDYTGLGNYYQIKYELKEQEYVK